MKKLLTLLLIIASFYGFSQQYSTPLRVKDSTTIFTSVVPISTLVQDTTTGNLWQLRSKGVIGNSLSNTKKQLIADPLVKNKIRSNITDSLKKYVSKTKEDTIYAPKRMFVNHIWNNESPFRAFYMNTTLPSSSTVNYTGIRNDMSLSGSSNQSNLTGLSNLVYDSCSGTTGSLTASQNYAYVRNGGTATNIRASLSDVEFQSTGSFNKLIANDTWINNTSTNTANNDAYILSGTATNSGYIDGLMGLNLKISNSGTLNESYGLRLTSENTGTQHKYYGIDFGNQHHWIGARDSAVNIFLDKSTNLGTIYNYNIKSETTAPSVFSGKISYDRNLASTYTDYSLISKHDLDSLGSKKVSIVDDEIITGGKAFAKGACFYGNDLSGLPTSVGNYVAIYNSSTYSTTRILGYNGTSYQKISIGAMPTLGVFSQTYNIDGTSNFGYKVGIGVPTPTQALDISGNININTNGTPILMSTNRATGTNGYNIFVGGGGQNVITDGLSNNSASQNVSIGNVSLYSLTSGYFNTAIGSASLYALTSGFGNTSTGLNSSRFLKSGNSNNTFGNFSLFSAIKTVNNSVFGDSALYEYNPPTSIGNNTIIGHSTARGIVTGSGNTIIGANIRGLASDLTNTIIIADGNGTNRLYVNNGGNVGINTTNPSERLTVNGNITANYIYGYKAIGTLSCDSVQTEIIIPSSTNWMKVTSFNTNELQQGTTVSVPFSNITVQRAGKYQVSYYFSSSSNINTSLNTCVFVNGVKSKLRTIRSMSAYAYVEVSAMDVLTLAANDQIDVRVYQNSGSQIALNPQYGKLSVTYLSE